MAPPLAASVLAAKNISTQMIIGSIHQWKLCTVCESINNIALPVCAFCHSYAFETNPVAVEMAVTQMDLSNPRIPSKVNGRLIALPWRQPPDPPAVERVEPRN